MADILYLMAFQKTPPVGSMNEVDYERDLHLTILPYFSIQDENLPQLCQELHTISKSYPKLSVTAYDNVELGTVYKVPAALVENIDKKYLLREIHHVFVEAVHRLGGHFAQYQFLDEHFNPHVSYWHGFGTMEFESVSLVIHKEGFGKGVVNIANYFFA